MDCINTNCAKCKTPCFYLKIDRGEDYNEIYYEPTEYKRCIELFNALKGKGYHPELKLTGKDTDAEILIDTGTTPANTILILQLLWLEGLFPLLRVQLAPERW